MVEFKWVRDGKQQILGTKSICTSTGIAVVRDRGGKILGYSRERFRNTRESRGRLVRSNEADTHGLLRQKLQLTRWELRSFPRREGPRRRRFS
jgi:hypothetical protein